MKRIWVASFLLLLLFFFCGQSSAREIYSQVRIAIPNTNAWQKFSTLGLSLEEGVRFHNRGIEMIVSSTERKRLDESGFQYVLIYPDMETFFSKRLASQSTDTFATGSMGGFYTFDQTLNRLNNFRNKYKTLISMPYEIGTSFEGRPILAYRLSDNADVEEGEPEVLYTALHHAREPQSLMVLLYFMEKLLDGYDTNPEIRYLMDNRQLWFIPVVNPDGYVYNQKTNPKGGGLWRKNRRENSDGSFGVDLNRNYGFKWGFDDAGSSPRQSDETYRGKKRFSEPEVRAIRDFVKSRKFILSLNYHSFRNLLVYPWGYKDQETVQAPIFREYATWMTRINQYGHGTSFSTLGYLTNGEADDWFYGDVQGKNRILSMTPEVGDFVESFWPPRNRILSLAVENFQANLSLAWLAGGYIVTKETKIKESVGNGNNTIQPGELASIRITLRNMGYRQTMKNVSASLQCKSNVASFNASVANFGDLKPFRDAERSFDVAFARTANTNQSVKFEIVISSGGTVLRKDFFSVQLQQ